MAKNRKGKAHAADQHPADAAVHQGAPEGAELPISDVAGEQQASQTADGVEDGVGAEGVAGGEDPVAADAAAGAGVAEGDGDGLEEQPAADDQDLAASGVGDPDLARLADDGGPVVEWPLDAPQGAEAAAGKAADAGAAAAADDAAVAAAQERLDRQYELDAEAAAGVLVDALGPQEPAPRRDPDWRFDRVFPGWDRQVSRAFAAAGGAAARTDFDPIEERAIYAAAAAFLRDNRDAKAETIVIHLRRAGHDVPEAEGRAAVAWAVFAFTLNALDELEAAQAPAETPAVAPAWPSDQALQPTAAGGFAAPADRF